MLFLHEFSQEEKDCGLIEYGVNENEGSNDGVNKSYGNEDSRILRVPIHGDNFDGVEVIELYTPPDALIPPNGNQSLVVDENLNQNKSQDQLTCPICLKIFENNNLMSINSHIDNCLVKLSKAQPLSPMGNKRKLAQTSTTANQQHKGRKTPSNSIITAFFKSK
jgi:hypothetical protein